MAAPGRAGHRVVTEADKAALKRHRSDAALQDAHAGEVLDLQAAGGNGAVARLIQAKLTVGPAGDAYEQEADRVAGDVMSSLDADAGPQRQEEEELMAKRVDTAQRQEDEELMMKRVEGPQRQPEEEELMAKRVEGVQRQEDDYSVSIPSMIFCTESASRADASE